MKAFIKRLNKSAICKKMATVVVFLFFQVMAWAQENEESGDGAATSIAHHKWYTQPWAVVTGIALVLIIIVSLVPTVSPEENKSADKLRT